MTAMLNHTHVWTMIEYAVDKMSPEKTAAISGTSAGVSFVTAATVPDLADINMYLQLATLSVSFIGACISVGLPILKFWIERRLHRRIK